MANNHPLLTQIQQGESKILELKAQLPQNDQIAKTLIAFANTSGGKLVIGVNDDRTLKGINSDDFFNLQDKISSIAHDSCSPNLLPHTYIENINGTELFIIEVTRGALLPYFLKSKGKEQGTYIRLNASNRLADANYITQLELQRVNQCFDEQINPNVNLHELDLTPLAQRFTQSGKVLDQQKLLNLKLIQKHNEQFYPTHGLLILLGYYEHAETKCARFKGVNMTVFLDKKEYTGDLIAQLEQAELFIKNHLHLKVEINGLQRTETYEIPMAAIREVLVNAYVHRDYSNFGRDIKVAIYDDRINIISPGALPNGLTLEDLHQGRSEIRNRVVARVFKALGLVEQWGSGVARIQQMLSEQGLEAVLREQGDFLDWSLSRATSPDEGISEGISEGINEGIKNLPLKYPELYAQLKQQPSSTVPQLAAQLGQSEATIERHLKWLKDHNYIKRQGAKKDGYWEVLR